MRKLLLALGRCLGAFPFATARADDAKPVPVAAADGAANEPTADEAPSDCVFGIAIWCFASTSRPATLPETKWRVEGNVGYKFSNIYYSHEIRGCDAAGCTL